MARSSEAAAAIQEALSIIQTEHPRTFSVSALSLEISLRDLVIDSERRHNQDTSGRRLPMLWDPTDITYVLHKKLFQSQLRMDDNRYAPITLEGREIDYLTEVLTPYTADDKDAWVEKRTQKLLADFVIQNPSLDASDLDAYKKHAHNTALTWLGLREGVVREIHEGYEAAGGKRRQSFIDRKGLFKET